MSKRHDLPTVVVVKPPWLERDVWRNYSDTLYRLKWAYRDIFGDPVGTRYYFASRLSASHPTVRALVQDLVCDLAGYHPEIVLEVRTVPPRTFMVGEGVPEQHDREPEQREPEQQEQPGHRGEQRTEPEQDDYAWYVQATTAERDADPARVWRAHQQNAEAAANTARERS